VPKHSVSCQYIYTLECRRCLCVHSRMHDRIFDPFVVCKPVHLDIFSLFMHSTFKKKQSPLPHSYQASTDTVWSPHDSGNRSLILMSMSTAARRAPRHPHPTDDVLERKAKRASVTVASAAGAGTAATSASPASEHHNDCAVQTTKQHLFTQLDDFVVVGESEQEENPENGRGDTNMPAPIRDHAAESDEEFVFL